jgi:2-phosphoglycerate kinase
MAAEPDAWPRPWIVLLLGGASGTGKTVAARELGRRLGVSVALADDFRLAMQRATLAESYPGLHYFVTTNDVWSQPAEALAQRLIAVGRTVSYALEVVVAHHALIRIPVILEGDGLLPSMAAQRAFAGDPVGDQVRAVFLHEADEDAILAAMRERGRGINRYTPEEQRTQARTSWLYGQWLRAEAERYGQPVVPARPYETLADRILAAIAPPDP